MKVFDLDPSSLEGDALLFKTKQEKLKVLATHAYARA